MNIKRVCVFCGSSLGVKSEYADAATSLTEYLVAQKIGIVYGGSNLGLMRIVADTAIKSGGEIIGVIPEFLVHKEVAHQGLTELRVLESMHERKALMSDLADAFIAMPGGYGTLEEFCEVLTWTQLELQRKPCGLLNVEGYYSPLLKMFDHAVKEGFLKQAHRDLVVCGEDPVELVERLRHARITTVSKFSETRV